MSASIRIAFVVIGLIVMAACGFGSTVVHLNIVDEVNSHLPSNQRFDPIGWHSGKTLRLYREYRRLFPSGGRVRQMSQLGTVGIIGLLFAAVALGFGVAELLWLGIGGAIVMWLPYWITSRI